jgi:hypothetical protein
MIISDWKLTSDDCWRVTVNTGTDQELMRFVRINAPGSENLLEPIPAGGHVIPFAMPTSL